ncbi:MAG TPA: hypothetical protein H9763_06470 [Candidatus Eisenbergiella merdigallinarum]|uniref:Uncharacterized protein n=1 Tax=Candidatus Eisenbergiella merdigallinarum TaxID=2838552 RepID=A0A9D2MRZ4_9FIRM|nr:hypothetical protein [Candidatus Eisenbergiella merdigallinarum]
MVICYRKKMIRIAQIWFEETGAGGGEKADIAFCHGIREPQKGPFRLVQTFHSRFSDLTLPEETLFLQISKTGRNEVRRSEKDGTQREFFDSRALTERPDVLEGLAEMYRRMYASKGREASLNAEQMRAYAGTGALYCSRVRKDGEDLVYHSYLADRTCARLLHSVSDFRESGDVAVISRANRGLHWEDMKRFAGMGLSVYDWGGISDPEHPNGIDQFKIKFGGEPVTYYNVIEGRTLLGKLAVLALKIKGF